MKAVTGHDVDQQGTSDLDEVLLGHDARPELPFSNALSSVLPFIVLTDNIVRTSQHPWDDIVGSLGKSYRAEAKLALDFPRDQASPGETRPHGN